MERSFRNGKEEKMPKAIPRALCNHNFLQIDQAEPPLCRSLLQVHIELPTLKDAQCVPLRNARYLIPMHKSVFSSSLHNTL